MNLIDQITQDLTAAMKAGNAEQTAVLRLIKSSFTNEKIKLGHELSDDEAMKVLQREVKQRRDSIDAYEKAGRPELAKNEEAERAIIAEYLPEAMSEAELTALIDQAIVDTGAAGPADMGKVIGKVMGQVAGKAEGGQVSALVKARLNQ